MSYRVNWSDAAWDKKEKEKDPEPFEKSPSEWFEWFVTTEEYKEVMKTLKVKIPTPQT